MAGSIEVKVDAREMAKLYADLKGVDGNMRVELRRGIVAAAQPVVAAEKSAAAFSTRIPGTIKAKVNFSARNPSVAITAGGPTAPHAAPINNRGNAGSFRHPVYGHRDTWVDQPSQPFAEPSLKAHAADAERAIVQAIDAVMRKAGFS